MKNLVRGQSGPRGLFLAAKNCLPGPENASVIGPSVPKVVLRGVQVHNENATCVKGRLWMPLTRSVTKQET